MLALGIDIGGSGIKGAIVDVARGTLAGERHRIATPQPSTPPAVAAVVKELVHRFEWSGPVGCTFPAVVKHGVVHTAANVDRGWIGDRAQARFTRATGCPVTLLNDADAAGIAEMSFGAARHVRGLVFVLTFGTGIGSALFMDGRLVPNTELGHLELGGKDAEKRASDKVREDKGLSWELWARRVDAYLLHLERLFSPDLFVIGGGASKKAERFLSLLTVSTRTVPATFRNQAGIIGAAFATRDTSHAGATRKPRTSRRAGGRT